MAGTGVAPGLPVIATQMLLALLSPLALADSFLTSIEWVCTPSVRGKVCGEGPLEETLERSSNMVEHAAILARLNGYRYNRSLIERVRHFTQYSESPYRNFDLQFVSFYGTTWGGKVGSAEMAIRGLLLEAARMPYDPAVQLVVGLCMAQYDAFILNHPWDEATVEKRQATVLLHRAAELSRSNPREGLQQTMENALGYFAMYPGYTGL